MKSTHQCGVSLLSMHFPSASSPRLRCLLVVASVYQPPASNIFPPSRAPCLPRARNRDNAQSFRFHFFSLKCQLTPGEFLFPHIFLSSIFLSTPSLPSLYAALGVLIVFSFGPCPWHIVQSPQRSKIPSSLLCFLYLCLWSMPVSLSFFRCLPGLLVNEEEKVSWPLLFTLVVLVGIDVDVVVGCLAWLQFDAPTIMALFSILSIP